MRASKMVFEAGAPRAGCWEPLGQPSSPGTSSLETNPLHGSDHDEQRVPIVGFISALRMHFS
eukprot:4796576-Alexandrium_andersonii.AAC.1